MWWPADALWSLSALHVYADRYGRCVEPCLLSGTMDRKIMIFALEIYPSSEDPRPNNCRHCTLS